MSKKGGKKGAIKISTEVNKYSVEVSQAITALQLLDSPEDQIVFLSICTLDVYVTKYGKNGLAYLEEYDLLGKIFTNLQKNNTIRVMCLKVLVKLSQLENVLHKIQETPTYINTLVDILMTTGNNNELEQSAYLLTQVGMVLSCAEIFCRECIILRLFTTIVTSTNLDVKLNCLQLLLCIIHCQNMAQLISQSEAFRVQILNLILHGPFRELRPVTVEIFKVITSWEYESMHNQLFERQTITFLFEVLSEEIWTSMQDNALISIFNCIKQHPIQIKSIESKKFLQFITIAKKLGPEHSLACLSILIELIKEEENRQVLLDLGIHKILIDFCKFDSDLVYIKFCDILTILCKNCHVIKDLATRPVITEIKKLMCKTHLSWNPTRQAGLQPLHYFIVNNLRVTLLCYQTGIHKYVLEALLHKDEIDQCYYKMALEIFQSMTKSKCLHEYLWQKNIYNVFITLFNDTNINFVKMAIEIIKNTFYSQKYRNWFLELNGAETIVKMIWKQECNYIDEALALCKTCTKYNNMTKALLQSGMISVLQDLGSNYIRLKQICDSIVDDIYACDLSIKFHDLWFLDCHDIIKNEFCVCIGYKPKNSHCSEVKDVDELFFTSTMFTVNFDKEKCAFLQSSITQEDILATGSAKSVPSEPIAQPKEITVFYNLPIPDKYLSTDYELQTCLTQVRKLLDEELSGTLLKKIEVLANFVASRLNGYDGKFPTKHQYETHISELKKKLRSNKIPLGHLRMGGMIERALLFKVFADHVNIPCTLRRTSDFFAWNEVTIYSVTSTCLSTNLKNNFVQHYIVDLLENVGALLLKDEHVTELYCTKSEYYFRSLEADVNDLSSSEHSSGDE